MSLEHVESASIALNVGPGKPWARDYITGIGWVAKYNKLGNAIIHLDSHRSRSAFLKALEAIQAIISSLPEYPHQSSKNIAEKGLKYYLLGKCLVCFGAGKNFEQVPCDECGGTGWVKPDKEQKWVKNLIELSLESLEFDLNHVMKSWYPDNKHEPVRSFNPYSSQYGTISPKHASHA